MVRTHDVFYLNEDRKETPKEYFKFLARNISIDYGELQNLEIVDVGCATGEFIYYMKKEFPNNQFTGIDILPELLEKAKEINEDQTFIDLNINAPNFNFKKKFDFVFMNGVHSIFDDVEPWLSNLLSLRKENGYVYLFGIFNPEDLDVLIKSKKSIQIDIWETGWNLFSLATMKHEIEKHGLSYEIIPWDLMIDLNKSDDPLRTWTLKLNAEGKRLVVNGLQLIHNFYLIKIGKRGDLNEKKYRSI